MKTTRQRILSAFYPVLMRVSKWLGAKSQTLYNEGLVQPPESLYNLSVVTYKKNVFPLREWQGKKLLLVNTASDCGYTEQYQELQQLLELYKNRLQIIAFPSNDFKDQENGSDEAILQFCKDNFGVRFPIALKSSVKKGPQQNSVFQWLSHKEKNGWNNLAPTWNFSKYLVNETGILTHYFDPSISPLDKEVQDAIKR